MIRNSSTHIQDVINDLENYRGRIYFPVELMDDDLLNDLVTAKIIIKSSGYIEDLARSHNIEPSKICKPTPYTIARIAEAYVFREAALKRTHGNVRMDEGNIDEYERKRQIYQKELDREIAKVTAETFTGGRSARTRVFPLSIPLHRG